MSQSVEVRQLFVAAYAQGVRVGVAFCEVDWGVMRHVEAREAAPYDTVRRVVDALAPAGVVCSETASVELRTALQGEPVYFEDTSGGRLAPELENVPAERLSAVGAEAVRDAVAVGTFPLHTLPAAEFALATARERLKQWQRQWVPDHVTDGAPGERQSAALFWLEPDALLSLRCISALLSFLQNSGMWDGAPVSIEPYQPDRLMLVPRSVLQSLQILEARNTAHGGGGGAVSLRPQTTLFGLVSRLASSRLGARHLRALFEYPLTDVEALNERLASVQALAQACAATSSAAMQTIMAALRAVRNVRSCWPRLVAGATTLDDWRAMAHTATAVATIIETLPQALDDSCPIAVRLTQALGSAPMERTTQCTQLAQEVAARIDLADGAGARRPTVRSGWSEELDELRVSLAALDGFLESAAAQERDALQQTGAPPVSLQIKFLPHIGYFLEVPAAHESAVSAAAAAAWQKCIEADGRFYFKNARMLQLDQELGDVAGAVSDKESEILRELESVVLPVVPWLAQAAELVAQLDSHLALALAADRCGWTRPELLDRDCELHIDVRDARHPLQELLVPEFVSNSWRMRRGDVCVLTGPNGSGKSVLLKQIAIVVYMAHIGSFVPAAAARIAITDRLCQRIRTFDSAAAAGPSAFATDCLQMASVFRLATPHSLAVVDEFGKGTAEEDGCALAAACMQYMAAASSARASVLFATHFHDAVLSLKQALAACTHFRVFCMDTLAQPTVPFDDTPTADSVTPLYTVAEDRVAADSHALPCALRNGIPPAVVSRAAAVRPLLNAVHDDVPGRDAASHPGALPDADALYRQRIRQLFTLAERFGNLPLIDGDDASENDAAIWHAYEAFVDAF